MNERSPQKSIRDYLQQSEVQDRIQQNMQEARSKATVTISQAALLFNFTENKLRDWEKKGLLQAECSLREKEGKGRRQYSLAELDKLAIIRELVTHGRFPLADIPPDVDKLWTVIAGHQENSHQISSAIEPAETPKRAILPIDTYAEENERRGFWHYFVEQSLRISLSLICQDIPDSLAGLIFPLHDRKLAGLIKKTDDLSDVGPSLIGWLERNRSFHTFLIEEPQFEFPTDFRLETLKLSQPQNSTGERVLDNVFIVLQRRARPLALSAELVETVRRILDLLYQRVDTWRPYYEYGPRDGLYLVHDLERASGEVGDIIFNSLLERVLELDKKTSKESKHWNFCTLMLPNDHQLPLQRQSLIVRAQTKRSPYKMGMTSVDPASTDSLTLKAFQSGQIIYFAETLPGQSMINYKLPQALSSGQATSITDTDDLSEKSIRSAIAVPMSGEYEIPIAVLYVAAESPHAFSIEDQRALRVISKMIEELLLASQVRRQAITNPGTMVKQPAVVDITFSEFASETNFLVEVEALLQEIPQKDEETLQKEENLSIISLDMDNQSRLALTYGNRVTRSLSQHVGKRIRGQMQLSERYAAGKLFHISADRYFLLLRVSLEDAQKLAAQLKNALQVTYRIKSSAASSSATPDNMLEIQDITFHLGVTSYIYKHLKTLLKRYPENVAVRRVKMLLVAGIEEELEMGKAEGGNCIITWNEKTRTHTLLK